MKKDLHPKLNPVVFTDTSVKKEFITMSTVTSEKTKTIKGVKHFVIEIPISSASHPFYTGKHRVIDTENLVKKFEKKTKKAETLSEKLKKSRAKKTTRRAKVEKTQEKKSLTLKDMLKNMQ